MKSFRSLHVGLFLLILVFAPSFAAEKKVFRAGAYAEDITPANFPVIVNGMFTERSATNAADRLHARCVVLDDGANRIAIAVVDSCMVPRDVIDRAKAIASKATGIRTDRMLVSSTHTHSAPSACGALGSRADTNYVAFLPGKIAEGIAQAAKNLAPARAGWAVVDDWEHTHNRRWIRRPDKMIEDPFGVVSVRANMHPGHQSPDAVGPSGPVDPGLSLLSLQSPDGRPIALLANYSQHYYGSPMLSADYYGRFVQHIGELIGATNSTPDFVGIMSQGTSGDLMWMDYGAPRKNIGYDAYAQEVAQVAFEAYKKIEYRTDVTLAMAERKLKLNRRAPDAARLAWARKIADGLHGQVPKSKQEVYALEAIYLHEQPTAELKLQALRIGDLGIAALPDEVFAITGLKLKAQSPLTPTFNIELANGGEGYIPPPEQHKLGGYTTWPARTAGLEVQAEPKIVETLLGLLEEVAGKPRRPVTDTHGAYAKAVLDAKPVAYWRLNEFVIPTARDASGHNHHATYEDGVALYLAGPESTAFSGDEINRAPHFAGGRVTAKLPEFGSAYSVEFWFWNGLPSNARGVTGHLFTRDADVLSIGGTNGAPGKLVFNNLSGKTEVSLKTWTHVALVRNGRKVVVYLNGQADIVGEADAAAPAGAAKIFIGGGGDKVDTIEGKIDEVAVFDRALSAEEIAAHERTSGMAAVRAREAQAREREEQLAKLESSAPVFAKGYADATLAAKPSLYWRMSRHDGATVLDATANKNNGRSESGVSFPGTDAAVFAGGRIAGRVAGLSGSYSVAFWFCNKLPNTARAVTAYLFSRGEDDAGNAPGDHLGIGGTYANAGRLIAFNGNKLNQVVKGRTEIPPNSWNHVVFVRDGRRVAAYLNGNAEPEFNGELAVGHRAGVEQIFLGGRNDNFANLNGQMAEVAVFNRALTPAEIASLHKTSGQPSKPLAVAPPPPPKMESQALSPAESQKKIHLRDGYAVELVASEPLLESPVAIDWDAAGRLWVVEMIDYPLGMDGNGKSGGRVRVLEDTDGDGRYDKSTIFADGLNFPNGLLTWRDGVLVTAAPDIWFLKDSNGDGVADIREPRFTGFFEGNQQLRVNGLRWGLDNWVHCAIGAHHSGYGKNTIHSKLAGADFDVGSRDFRIRPDTGAFDPQSGPTQFGRNPNNWGDWFGVQNSFPLWHYALADHYTRRNPHVAPPDPVVQLMLPSNPQVFPARPPEKRYHSFTQAGHFTSACAAMIYRDELLFGRDSYDHAFTCEPVHCLVHHELVSDNGVTFSARRADGEEQSEFFASEDTWCRPVMIRAGPDGALWVVDMYRYMIEHPQWLPPEGKADYAPFYRAGDNLGRIYRVFPKNKPPRPMPRLDKMTPVELVAALDSPSGWQRDKAQQMLLWRADKSVVPSLEKMIRENKNPLARLHALCTLDGLGALRPELVERALADAHPGVRRHAVRLAESRAKDAPQLIATAVKLVNDPDAKVRLQLACTLGEWNDPRAGQALAHIALANCNDTYITGAVMSSALNHSDALVNAVAGNPAAMSLTESLLNLSLGLERRDLMARMVSPMMTARAEQMQSFGRFLDSLRLRKVSLEKLAAGEDALAQQLKRTSELFATARQIVADTKQPSAQRIAATALLGRDGPNHAADIQLLAGLLSPQTPIELQRATVKALGALADANVPALLLKDWSSHGLEIVNAIVDELLTREPWALALLRRIESDEASAVKLDASQRERLLKHRGARIRTLAEKVFAATANPDRQKVIEEFRAAVTLPGKVEHGREVFRKLCITCHQLENVGHEIGANLRSVSAHPPEKLLTSILDPSRDVDPRYLAFSCELRDGEEIYGIIAAETGSSVALKLQNDTTRTVLRSDIASLRSGKLSLMPDGLEKGLTPQDLADVIAYLKSFAVGN